MKSYYEAAENDFQYLESIKNMKRTLIVIIR